MVVLVNGCACVRQWGASRGMVRRLCQHVGQCFLELTIRIIVHDACHWTSSVVHALPSSSCHIKGRKFVGRDWRKQPDSLATRVRRTDHVVVCSAIIHARLFGPGPIVKSTGGPATPPAPPAPSIIEAVTPLRARGVI